jgi:4-amino-4-deoxy-L-arabinose transferase-like glycosyltransferase
MLERLRQIGPVRIALVLLVVLTCYRLWYATRIELVPDEAYYWLWSKRLAAAYRDKGPLVAWTIALGTKLFGNTVFGIRFFAVLLSTGIGWLLFVLARRLYDDRVALWSLLVAAVIPELAVGSILMTIDPLSVFFWILAALLFWRAIHGGNLLHWFGTGLAIGAGFLAKFTNGVQLACIGLFLLWSKEHRRLLFSRGTVLMGLAFLIAITPILWWNAQTGWVHATALRSRSGVKESFGIHPGEFLQFIGGQFAVVSPLFMAGMLVAAVALICRRDADVRTRFLLSQSLPVYGVFAFFALNKAGQPNWTVPALLIGIVFTVAYWRDRLARNPAWRGWITAAFALAIVMSTVMHDTSYLHLPPRLDPLRRAQGWPDFADHVQRARAQHQTELLIGDHYSVASMMAFYLPDHPTTYVFTQPYGKSQFTLWPGYEVRPDTRALYVTDSPRNPPKVLEEEFNRIELIDDFMSQHRGRPMTRFWIYLCTRSAGVQPARTP